MPFSRLLVFVAVVSLILGGVHYYIWARLVRDAELPSRVSWAASAAMIALGIVTVASLLLLRGPSKIATPIAWVGYTWLGVVFFLFVLVLASDAGRLVVGVVRWGAGASPLDPERRLFFSRAIALGLSLVGFGESAAGLASCLSKVAVKRVRVGLPRLAEKHAGYRIVQLTDLHVGPTIHGDFVRDLVTRVNALEPDVIAITGDLVDGSVTDLRAFVEPLRDLHAKDGVYFVTGNHEYYSGADEWTAFLSSIGIKVLKNEHVALDAFVLAGVEDASAHNFKGHGADLPRALLGRDEARALVLLAHQPKAIFEAEPLGVGLQISGHTHGGQFFPWNFLVRLQQPYVSGLHAHGRAQIYVSNGTGYWGPPMRLGFPAEITEIELFSA